MARRSAFALLSAWTLALATPAFSASYLIKVSIGAGPLPQGLQTLERQTGVELLFDHDLISGLQAPPVSGDLTTEAALRQLLSQSGLTLRRSESGAWIVERPDTPPLAQPDAVVPEMMIIGQRSQNADIRRFENDVQPYLIATKDDLLTAHRDDLDQYFTSRITANTQVTPRSLAQQADVTSEINLRGLGSSDTLVLVDGRRMPTFPAATGETVQSDLNAIPLHAIKRVEVLTGAASGIYGFGALGGVVNVVLDRDDRGVDLYVTEGLSSRGDGFRQTIEARFGGTSGDGATDFTVFAGHTRQDSVLAGNRDYAVNDRRKTFEALPEYGTALGDSVRVTSLFQFDPVTSEIDAHPKLVFKPEYGGATLPSDATFLPAGFAGDSQALVATLTRNAGQQDFTLPPADARTDLGSNPRTTSLLANLRHRFGAGLEAYADVLLLRSRGQTDGDYLHMSPHNGSGLIGPDSPVNPFTGYINIDYPIGAINQWTWKRTESTRYTGGITSELPFDWRATAEASAGSFHYEGSASILLPSANAFLILLGDDSDRETNPFGDWNTFQRVVAADSSYSSAIRMRSRFRDQSLRLAGPVFSTAAGPAPLTLLAEHRAEHLPGSTWKSTTFESDGSTTPDDIELNGSATTTDSFYAELRPRVFGDIAPLPLLRGLEIQLAVRRDDQKNDFSRDIADPDSARVHARFQGTTYTAGAKISPTSWLMLRGSYATGEQPPSLLYITESDPITTSYGFATDPKRGDTDLGADGDYVLRGGGNKDLKTRRATSTFLGTVLTPWGQDGPRLAIDYSRIRRARDAFTLDADEIMANEDAIPDRVVREPLTDEDRAKGYTGGRVALLDTRSFIGASVEVDAFDTHISWPLPFLGGRLRLYAEGSYHERNVVKVPFQADVNSTGHFNGPLKWRANGGLTWSTEELTFGANLQYFGKYLVITDDPTASGTNDLHVEMQGARSIPSQSYLDLQATWRVPGFNFGPVDTLTVDFGIVNALDKAPPREAQILNSGPAYSRYGDPRQRRFELGLSCHF